METIKLKTKLTPLRTPGGKSNALSRLRENLKWDFTEYREPFFGGGSVGLYLMQQNKTATYRINDLFYPVYCFWKALRDNPNGLEERIAELKCPYGEGVKGKKERGKQPDHSPQSIAGRELFDRVKKDLIVLEQKQSETEKDILESAALCYVINKLSFSGMMLQGTYSELAWDQNFTNNCINNGLRKASELFKSVIKYGGKIEITHNSYEELLKPSFDEKVFIFLDPPYDITCNLYGKDGKLHENFSHEKFAQSVRACSHNWLVTYNDNSNIRSLFPENPSDGLTKCYIEPWDLTYTMKATKRNAIDKAEIQVAYKKGEEPEKSGKKGKELLISNYKLNPVEAAKTKEILNKKLDV